MTAVSSSPRLLRTCASVLIACLQAGCVRGSLPTRELYRLRTVFDATPSASSRTNGMGGRNGDGVAASRESPEGTPPIAVEMYATPGVYSDPQIVYRVDDVRYATYPNREWALPLGAMLATLTAESLRREFALGTRIQEGVSRAPGNGLLWRGTVREFEEVNRGREVFAAVRLSAALVRVSDDSVVWQGEAHAERPVVPPNAMTAVVDTLSAVAASVIRELASQAQEAIRSGVVPAATAIKR
jgi:uncharacterized lipoprotein YmbA